MSQRLEQFDRLDDEVFDVLIVGGGINGAVSAAAAAASGLSVALVEQGDFAGFTSQESSNLVWGGFKYLENYELKLVWDLCSARNRMLEAFPTRLRQLDFVATLDKTAPFPVALAALGALGYWGFGRFATRFPRVYRARDIESISPIVDTSSAKGGIRYADAYIPDNDARFTWGFVRNALDRGAACVNYASLQDAKRVERDDETLWEATVVDQTERSQTATCRARAVVNAAGPFVDGLNQGLGQRTEHRIVYSKGIHLIVPKLHDAEHVLAFFDDTGRLFYVIPMAHRSVIGTTDTRTEQPDEGVTEEDRTFLLDQINARLDLNRPLEVADVIAERSGVRPLVVKADGGDHTSTDWTSLSRKHEIEADDERRVISIFGGKLTDCVNVGIEIVEALADMGIEAPGGSLDDDHWFGEPGEADRSAFLSRAVTIGLDRSPEVEWADSMAEVLWRRHGPAAHDILDRIEADPTEGEPILPETDVLLAELTVMAEREMLVERADFLRRRTKLSLITQAEVLEQAFADGSLDALLGIGD